MRLLLILRGYHPRTSPAKIGEFVWTPKHGAYVWEGRELKPTEFNEVVNRVVDANKDLWAHPITVLAVNDDSMKKARATLAQRLATPKPAAPNAHSTSNHKSIQGLAGHPPAGRGRSNQPRREHKLLPAQVARPAPHLQRVG